MFWGKGDSSKLGENEHEILEALRRMVETGHIHALDPESTEVALRAIDFYRTFESGLRMFGMVRNIAILVAGGLMLWWSLGGEGFITETIRNMVGNP